MNDVGIDPGHIGRAAFAARIESDTARYDQVIRRAGIRLEQ
jgi:tripartite-type tricarboxylate transporter receptor subunit TctC